MNAGETVLAMHERGSYPAPSGTWFLVPSDKIVWDVIDLNGEKLLRLQMIMDSRNGRTARFEHTSKFSRWALKQEPDVLYNLLLHRVVKIIVEHKLHIDYNTGRSNDRFTHTMECCFK